MCTLLAKHTAQACLVWEPPQRPIGSTHRSTWAVHVVSFSLTRNDTHEISRSGRGDLAPAAQDKAAFPPSPQTGLTECTVGRRSASCREEERRCLTAGPIRRKPFGFHAKVCHEAAFARSLARLLTPTHKHSDLVHSSMSMNTHSRR